MLVIVPTTMAETVALRIGSWLTAKAIENLAEYFLNEAGGHVFAWCKSLQHMTSSIEYRAVAGDDSDGGIDAKVRQFIYSE